MQRAHLPFYEHLVHVHMHTRTLHTCTCREWYEPQSMMLSEDAAVVCGLLMGLNALDYNVMMSGEDFDKSVSPCRHEAWYRMIVRF